MMNNTTRTTETTIRRHVYFHEEKVRTNPKIKEKSPEVIDQKPTNLANMNTSNEALSESAESTFADGSNFTWVIILLTLVIGGLAAFLLVH